MAAINWLASVLRDGGAAALEFMTDNGSVFGAAEKHLGVLRQAQDERNKR
jgi:hypothetical protein